MLEDKFGRKINYARISVTDLCNLRCAYCMPQEGVEKNFHSDILRVEEIITLASVLIESGIDKIRLTGGEPLVRKGIFDIIEGIGKIDGLKSFCLTTNAIHLNDHLARLKSSGLTNLNISVDSLVPEKFAEITRGGELDKVLTAIDHAIEMGFKVKLNAALVKGFNDSEIPDFVKLTKEKNVDVRFIELMAIGKQAGFANEHFLPADYVLTAVPELVSVESSDKSSAAVYYKLPEALGRVGLIKPLTCKFCSNCNRIRVTADGKLKNCLHTDVEIDIKPALNDREQLKKLIQFAISEKPEEHKLNEGQYIVRNMSQIGG